MIRLTKKQILELHSQLIKVYGGSDGIRDEKLLESALENPFQSFGGKELTPVFRRKRRGEKDYADILHWLIAHQK